MALALLAARDTTPGADMGTTLEAPLLRRLYEDWRLRRQYPVPRRADFDPATLGYALGSLSLYEVWRNPIRFRARVHGTRLAQHLGVEFTGKFLDEAPPTKYLKLAIEHMTEVVETARPSWGWLIDRSVEPPTLENESLVLPLSRDGYSVDYLFTALIHHRPFTLNSLTEPVNHVVPLPA